MNRHSNAGSINGRRRDFVKSASIAALGMTIPITADARGSGFIAYIGTYTNKTSSKGIYRCRLDAMSGELKLIGTTPLEDPSFLVIDDKARFLYAVSETGDYKGRNSGAVSAFSIDQRSGDLRLINQQASEGAAPCYVTVDKKRRVVLVANYSSGNVAVLPVKGDGSLDKASFVDQHKGAGINPDRQKEPHAHSILLDERSDLAFSADLGTDRIYLYRLDSKSGKLKKTGEAALKPGAGPRHIAIHPNGRFAYVIDELDSTITAFKFDRAAFSDPVAVSTLPNDFTGQSYCADIHIHPSGKFLYGSNRGHNSIAAFAIDQATGKLSSIQYQSTLGNWPRNFAIDPTGNFLLAANQNSNNIASFRINQLTGRLAEAGFNLELPAPVCIKIIPFLF